MANINDYLYWRGDVVICNAAPFNEIDDLILARFSYLPFDKTFFSGRDAMGSFCKVMKELEPEDFHLEGDREFIEALPTCARFRDMVVTDYKKSNDPEIEKQFSAITVHISADEIYLSFCGTDSTLVGWKEDFNMSFMENVPSQCAALLYARDVMDKYPKAKVHFGGHSKGGNLAVYAAICLDENYRSRILSVTNFDGPGFSGHFLDIHEFDGIVDRIKTFIPQDSVFGRIMDHAEDHEVVKSTAAYVYQHDIFSWQVERTTMNRLDDPTDDSNAACEALHRMLEDTSPEQRKLCVNLIYRILTSTDARTLADLKNIPWSKTPNILKSIISLGKKDWDAVGAVIESFIKCFGSVYMELGAAKINAALNELKENPADVLKISTKL